MIKDIKIIYYVDSDDNTKGALMAFPSDKDLRTKEVRDEMARALVDANFGNQSHCDTIAWEIAHNGMSETICGMGRYEFGIEETELYY